MTTTVSRRRVCALMMVLMAVAAIVSASAAAGTPAPNVEMRTAKGPRVRLSDFRGKVVVMEIFDPRAKIPEAFGTTGMPTSYIIDPRGMIRYTHEGYDTSTDAAYRREIMTLLTEWSESSNRN